MIRIPAEKKVMKELWIHASNNRKDYMKVYYNGSVMLSYSSIARSVMTYKVEPIQKSMLGDKPLTLAIKLLEDETAVFETTEEDPTPYIMAIKSVVPPSKAVKRIQADPSRLNKATMNAVLGSTYKFRLRPLTMTKHYKTLLVCDDYWWMHGELSDFFLIRTPALKVSVQASSQSAQR